MSKLKSFLGYSWALTALPLILATFIGLNTWARGLAEITGVKISPWHSGGEVARTIPHDGYKAAVYEPVFQGLVGERKKGFIQVKWTPDKGRRLPVMIDESIDLDADGTPDFRVRLDTKMNQAQLDPYKPHVLGVTQVFDLGDERAVRVKLLNPRRTRGGQ